MVSVAAVGDVLDINCWSNIPYFFFREGKKHNLFDEPWRINLKRFELNRFFWNAKQTLLYFHYGGYQYSKEFLDKIEHSIKDELKSSTVISFNQHFPRASTINHHGGKIYYYIDTPFSTLANAKSYNVKLPKSVYHAALNIEQNNYRNAEKIVTMASWAADVLINDYKIDNEKILTILPGANIELPSDFSYVELNERPGIDRPLKLGFIGKDWKRKGGPFLIDLKKYLERNGFQVEVNVIGKTYGIRSNISGINYHGYIDKIHESGKFIQIISNCDIGCLFSVEEALGISTLEFLRVGVPVMGFDLMGLKDTLIEGSSLKFDRSSTYHQVGDTIIQIIREGKLHSLRNKAIEISSYVTWERCIREWEQLMTDGES